MSAGRRHRRAVAKRSLFVVQEIPESADSAMKDALAIRNAATLSGRCPSCGASAKLVVPPRPGRVGEARMAHESGCPALLKSAR